MQQMQKTTIRLPRDLYVSTKKKAAEEGIPMQQVIARALRRGLSLAGVSSKAQEKSQGHSHVKSLLQLTKKLEKRKVSGPADLAANTDKYLYGEQ